MDSGPLRCVVAAADVVSHSKCATLASDVISRGVVRVLGGLYGKSRYLHLDLPVNHETALKRVLGKFNLYITLSCYCLMC